MESNKGGRPAVYGSRLKRTSVTLPVEYIEYLKVLGDGNISNAVRKLIEQIDAPIEAPRKEAMGRKKSARRIAPTDSERPVYIYGLCDPGSSNVRYVGKTVNLKSRLAQHLYRRGTTVYGMNPCATWIDELMASGQRPDLIVLEETTEGEWEEKEREWIKVLVERGVELLNVSTGGLAGEWMKTYPNYDRPPVAKDVQYE